MRLSTNATESFETHLSSEVLENGGAVDGSGGSNPPGGERAALEVAMDPEKFSLEREWKLFLSIDSNCMECCGASPC